MLLVVGRSWTDHVSPCGDCAASPSSEQPIERRLETLVLVLPLRGDVGLRSTLNQTRTLASVWRVSRSAPSRTPKRGLNVSRVPAQRRVQSRERETRAQKTCARRKTLRKFVQWSRPTIIQMRPHLDTTHHGPDTTNMFSAAVTRGSVRQSEHRKTQSPKTRPRCGNFQSLWMTASFL